MNKINRIFMSLLGNRKKSRLPSGYTELEYIENPSTAYINTGVTLNNSDSLQIHIDGFTCNTTSFSPIFGALRAYSGVSHRIIFIYDGVGGTYQIRWASAENFTRQNQIHQNCTIDLNWTNGLQTHLITNGVTTINATTTQTDASPIDLYSTYLFAYNNNGSQNIATHLVGNIGNFSLTQNGLKVIDYVPAQRDSDGVVGMYDLVSNTFKTSLSSDSFVAGPIKQL